jgi:hypothetical protein
MFVGREAAQVCTDLRHHDLGRPPTEARDRVYPRHDGLDRAHPFCNFIAQVVDQLVHPVQVRELLSEQEAVMCLKLALQSALQLGELFAKLVLGQIRQLLRVRRAANQRLQHPPRRDAQDVAGNEVSLESQILLCVLPAVARATVGGALGHPGQFYRGLAAPLWEPDLLALSHPEDTSRPVFIPRWSLGEPMNFYPGTHKCRRYIFARRRQIALPAAQEARQVMTGRSQSCPGEETVPKQGSPLSDRS